MIGRRFAVLGPLLASLMIAGSALAQSGAEYSAWLSWCRQQGGTPNGDPNNPVCTPGGQGGGSSGWTPAQQGMLGLAGSIGSALGNAIRESIEAEQRRAALQRMQQAWELERARIFAVQERERLSREMRERNEALMAKLKGGVQRSELSLVRVERKELKLRSRDEMFGIKSGDPTSTTQDVVLAGSIATAPAPKDVDGKAVVPNSPDEARQAWDDYLAALQRKNRIEAELGSAEQRHSNAQFIVAGARKQAENERVRASAALDAPAVGDDKLAEAERLLAEATALDEKAAKELEQAKTDAEQARKTLDDAQRHAVQTGSLALKQTP